MGGMACIWNSSPNSSYCHEGDSQDDGIEGIEGIEGIDGIEGGANHANG